MRLFLKRKRARKSQYKEERNLPIHKFSKIVEAEDGI